MFLLELCEELEAVVNKLEELGFEDPLDSDDIPAEFKTAEWRQSV